MKRREKPVFFIVALFILTLSYTAIFGVYARYGDRRDTFIRGADSIRLGIDIQGGVDVTFGPKDENVKVDSKMMDAVRDIIIRRLIAQNITDHEVYSDVSNKQVLARFPWRSDDVDRNAAEAVGELGQTAKLTFNIDTTTPNTKTEKDSDGNDIEVPAGDQVITGSDINNAEPLMYQDDNGQVNTVVRLTLFDESKQKFADATLKQYTWNQQNSSNSEKATISIWLDNEMISNPTVNAHITDGVATIESSDMTYQDAVDLSNLINSGALPFDVEVKSVGTIDASLGRKSLDIMVLSGVIAFALVSIFMLLYYRLPGFVAVISLLGQVAGSLAVVSGYFGFTNSFTLTLPGIAGIILSVGMGVDANIITSERIKEEIRAGRTIDGAISRGSKDSFWAIFDGNITNIIVAVVLMGVFGPPTGFWAVIFKPVLMWFPSSTTGAIYSFGYTLIAGIVFNFIMGVIASRMMLRSLTRFKLFRKPWLLGGDRA